MVVFAYSYNDDEWQSHGWAMGASGVTLELESMEDFVEGGTLIIGLSTPNIGSGVGPAAAWGGANLAEQAFHLEGVVVAPGPAPAA